MTESRDRGAQCHEECHDNARDRRGAARDQDLKHETSSQIRTCCFLGWDQGELEGGRYWLQNSLPAVLTGVRVLAGR